jgi:uncharacterized protein (DUF2164 family)
MPIELPKPTLDQLTGSVRRYLQEEMDLDCGELQARLLLDFVLAEVGPAVYNHAIRDAASFMQDRVLDMDATCHEPEMTWWDKKRRR